MPREIQRYDFVKYFYDDFANDPVVEVMSTLAVGAYTRIWWKSFRQNPVGSVPDNDEILAQWARVSLEKWHEKSALGISLKEEVMAAWKLRGSRWHQKRTQQEYKAVKSIQKTNKDRGTAGGKALARRTSQAGRDAPIEQCLVSANKKEKEKEIQKEKKIQTREDEIDDPQNPDYPLDPDAARLIRDTGIGVHHPPQDNHRFNALVRMAGYDRALDVVNRARVALTGEKRGGGKAFLAWAETTLGREIAGEQLDRGKPRKTLTGPIEIRT